MSSPNMDALKALVAARAAKAVEVAATHLATQWSLVRPGSTKEQMFEAHVEQEGASAKVVIDSDIAAFITFGTGVYGGPENAPHRMTPWVYYDDREMGFRTTWGTHPHPDYQAEFDAEREEMMKLMTSAMSDEL